MKKYIHLAILTSLALVISLFESAMPLPFVAPGAKLGLANVVILTTLVVYGFKEALSVGVLKSLALVFVTGSVTSMFYSLAGALGSILVMSIAYRFFSKYLSLIGVSILGSSTHNLCQVALASFITKTPALFAYLPILLVIGLFTGFFVGLGTIFVSSKLVKLNIGD